jgi:hypothetical protein
MYVVTTENKRVKTFNDINCSGIIYFSTNMNYCYCRETQTAESSLKFFDMEQIIREEKCTLFTVMKLQVGKRRTITFCRETERYAFIPALTKCYVIPILHLNTSRLIGSPDNNEDFLVYKVFADKLVGLTKNHNILTWCLVTGKLLECNHLPANMKFLEDSYIQDTSYSTNYDRFVFSKRDEDLTPSDCYEPDQLATSLKMQTNFIMSSKVTMAHSFQIEILNAKEVKVNMCFIRPASKVIDPDNS